MTVVVYRPSKTSSSTTVMVTVCGLFQSSPVKVRVSGWTVICAVSSEITDRTESEDG